MFTFVRNFVLTPKIHLSETKRTLFVLEGENVGDTNITVERFASGCHCNAFKKIGVRSSSWLVVQNEWVTFMTYPVTFHVSLETEAIIWLTSASIQPPLHSKIRGTHNIIPCFNTMLLGYVKTFWPGLGSEMMAAYIFIHQSKLRVARTRSSQLSLVYNEGQHSSSLRRCWSETDTWYIEVLNDYKV